MKLKQKEKIIKMHLSSSMSIIEMKIKIQENQSYQKINEKL
jgi:hypothetical protein